MLIFNLRPGPVHFGALLVVVLASLVGSAAAQSSAAPQTVILITNANIFDGTHEKLAAGMSVLVEGNKITKIGRSIPAHTGAKVIDASGRVLMPGLIDTHQHLNQGGLTASELLDGNVYFIGIAQAKEAERTLMRGVTTVRDPGGDSFGVKQAIDKGLVPGPRIEAAGPVVGQTNGHGDNRLPYTGHPRFDHLGLTPDRRLNLSYLADGVSEVMAATREVLRQGASFIKIMAGGGVGSVYDPIDSTQYTEEEMKAAVKVAGDWNTYVAAHAYTNEAVRRAIDAGIKVIEHGHLIDEETMKYAVTKGIWFTSQYLVFTIEIPGLTEAQKAKQRRVLESVENFFALAKKYNAKLTFGTDLNLGVDTSLQNKELVMRSKWFTPYEILVQATSRGGELIALAGPRNPYPGKLGVIEEGAYADMLLVDGNPLQNIELVGHPETSFVLIMKDGKVYKNTLVNRGSR
jgi:imidazolonepropionase-like amidohydrolase